MRPWIRWLAVVLFIGAMAWMSKPTPLPRVPLSGGRELRVLKISLGTNHVLSAESIWKQCVRHVMPEMWQKHLGTFQGHRFQTRFDSLTIWFSEFTGTDKRTPSAGFTEPEAILANGVIAKGQPRPNGRVFCFEFPWFAREAKQVTLRVRDTKSRDFVTFNVDNPRPARAANWIAPPTPQTNHSRWTEIVLRELRPVDRAEKPVGAPFQAYVGARGLGRGHVGWLGYRTAIVDRWGNWSEIDWAYANRFRVPPLPGSSTAKLFIEGQEFISGGFVPEPTNGSCVVLPPMLRAQDLGVRLLALVGPGAYRFTNAVGSSVANTNLAASIEPVLNFMIGFSGTNSVVELGTPLAGILCLFDSNAEAPSLRARLRERIGANGGRLFWPVKYTSARSSPKHSQQTAAFFALRLPATTTNLEVEVIALHPPVEFVIDPPRR